MKRRHVARSAEREASRENSFRAHMTSVDRRTFLKGVAAVSAVAAGSAVANDATAQARADVVSRQERPPVWKKAPCRLCGVGCGLLVGIQGGRAVAVQGDPKSTVGDGLACAKGYYSVQALYARDRLKRAMIRRDNRLVEVPIGEALDLVAQRLRETTAKYGKDSVALYGSAQWTIPDAYVASKLFKGALGTNNVESSTRLASASAMAGLEGSFGLDGTIGCYEDIEHADIIVLWDINIAETDPVLFSRMLARRKKNPAVRIVEIATRTTRTSYAADHSVLHTPRSTQAIANAICQEIVARKWVDQDFVDRHVAFRRGRPDIGYGITSDALVADDATTATWDEYVSFLGGSTPERVQALSGAPAASIRWLASLYGDRSRKVMSVWGANVNQHARGTYTNNALYNIHLLVGKIASPGNSPFAITGQPGGGNALHDAGSLTHTLPRGVVRQERDRQRAADIWGVPVGQIDSKPTHAALSMFRALDRGDVRFLWIQATNPMVSLPNVDRYRRAAGKEGRFIVVSELYPTATTAVADVVLPSAMWFEREGIDANVERRLQHFDLMVAPPGDAMSDAWQMIEVARRLGFGKMFPAERRGHVEQLWNEYRKFHEPPSTLPALSHLREGTGAMWPVVDGHETKWRYNTALDPKADRARGRYDFYGHADGRAWIWLRPNEPPAESTDADFPFWLNTGAVLEQSGTGSITQRIPTLHRAVPRAYVEINGDDATRLRIRDRDLVRLTSRRGAIELEARIEYRSQPQRGTLFVPSFDESLPVSRLMLDAFCPISGQPDLTTCAVRVERVASAAGG
ncbi:MAG: molybdopterin-dependent oxidoreductase [Gemmatimonas sp.]